MNLLVTWEKSGPDRGKSKGKGPEAEVSLLCWESRDLGKQLRSGGEKEIEDDVKDKEEGILLKDTTQPPRAASPLDPALEGSEVL